ncbi:MAG: asparagine synthetase B [Deltaproteobacteria bacterium]|nr:asparagine synthetase B [Deltaproteobacteria bacterium]
MCGIAGIVTTKTNESGLLLESMLRAMQHRGPDGAGFAIGGIVERRDRIEELDFRTPRGEIALGHIRLAITGEATALQPFQSRDGKIVLLHNGELYNHEELRYQLNTSYPFETRSDSEVIVRLVEKFYQGDLEEALVKTLPLLDGVYCLALTDNKKVVIARDRIGVRQLYYCKNHTGGAAFASEKKPLMTLASNRSEIRRLLPGTMATIDTHSIREQRFWSSDMIRSTERITNEKEALRFYGEAITEAVRKRVAGRKRVGIIFSGGIDSLLIAHLVRELGVPFTCYTAGRGEQAVDLEWAIRLADRFDFPLVTRELTTNDVGDLLENIITDIEDHSLNQVEVAVPIYASVQLAQEAGERVILTGQGADELFGGYLWYASIVDQESYQAFEQRSWEDAFLLYKECLEREDKIAMAHSMELRVPFLDPAVIAVAFAIAPELKIKRGGDALGKRVHREYCVSVGIPEEIAYRKKEAAQHGANVHTAFEELAQRLGLTDQDVVAAGYDPEKSVSEKLGSSSRYGFRYGDHHLWKPLPHVQYFLDSIAAPTGILPDLALAQWKAISNRLSIEKRP